jgi:chemotaxis protein methyltransferase CheR
VQIAVDLLTTNETYFFRESKHFEFLRAQAIKARNASQPYRVWSAASSSGEEAYSIAMVLADCMQTTPWDIVGTDISTRVLEGARRALYSLERGRHIPPEFLKRYCRKGHRQYDGYAAGEPGACAAGWLCTTPTSTRPCPSMGKFDIVFLRNVMIYFNNETKRQVVARVIGGHQAGWLFFHRPLREPERHQHGGADGGAVHLPKAGLIWRVHLS